MFFFYPIDTLVSMVWETNLTSLAFRRNVSVNKPFRLKAELQTAWRGCTAIRSEYWRAIRDKEAGDSMHPGAKR
jgi:hypothetical protein